MLGFLAPLLAAAVIHADTMLILGSREIDMTGDGRPEILTLFGTGPSIDSLSLTFRIVSSDEVVYEAGLLPITRRIGYDGPRRNRTAAQQVEFVGQLGASFFAASQFVPASRFLMDLSRSTERVRAIPGIIARHRATYRNHALGRLELAPPSTDTTGAGAIWAEMLRRDRIVFRFSPGGDLATAIAWSDRDRRFYRLLECC
jgi:hypothetical protein